LKTRRRHQPREAIRSPIQKMRSQLRRSQDKRRDPKLPPQLPLVTLHRDNVVEAGIQIQRITMKKRKPPGNMLGRPSAATPDIKRS
jgi:hypothetical protein